MGVAKENREARDRAAALAAGAGGVNAEDGEWESVRRELEGGAGKA